MNAIKAAAWLRAMTGEDGKAAAEQIDVMRGLLAEATAYLPPDAPVFGKIMQFFQENP